MVTHDILVHGTSLTGPTNPDQLSGTADPKCPVILQMNDTDFPSRFLQDMLTGENPKLSTAEPVSSSAADSGTPQTPPPSPVLFQPVQRMLNVALIQMRCNSFQFPRVDPTRIVSSGLVVRRVYRRRGRPGSPAWDDHETYSAWMRNAQGQWDWVALSKNQETQDPDPTKRPQLKSGNAALDAQLAAMALSAALTESTTPAFAAPPATCAALNRTVVYGVVPTASSEVSDTPPQAPSLDPTQLLASLPGILRACGYPFPSTLLGANVDYRWLSPEYLNTLYPPASDGTPAAEVTAFQQFTLALRMLDTVFGAFDGSTLAQDILGVLNRRKQQFAQSTGLSPMGMGDFYELARTTIQNVQAYPTPPSPIATLAMPTCWEWLNGQDQKDLIAAIQSALAPRSQKLMAPMGRFQDNTRLYKLRFFIRLKGETPNCPTELIWSQYSEAFRIAAWFETGNRAHPPVPLPDPTSNFMKNVKPNCSFQVPANLMNAMNGTSMSGLLKGSGGGGGVGLGWICGFNIPLITICAFFVLNIFLSLLNIVFFWLPFIKICIPIPMPSGSDSDG